MERGSSSNDPVASRAQGRDRPREHVTGCLLGGAIGDALGAPAELWSLAEIRKRLGPRGVRGNLPVDGRVTGAITDDTQMTLFTAEGLIRAHMREVSYGICSPLLGLRRAYLRWLLTQNEAWPRDVEPPGLGPSPNPWIDGWLIQQPVLRARRAPGNTCLAALRAGGAGTLDSPPNDSKGCGAVMRSAPIGLVAVDPFDLGVKAGVLTHGHPSAYLPAGAFASMISRILGGAAIGEALDDALHELRKWPGHEETLGALLAARRLVATGRPSPEDLETLGGGWTGHEALAIAVAAALVADDVEDGLLLAVNHSGDSDSTGAICGNLLGVLHGAGSLPPRLVAELEARDVIERVAEDFFEVFWIGGNWAYSRPGRLLGRSRGREVPALLPTIPKLLMQSSLGTFLATFGLRSLPKTISSNGRSRVWRPMPMLCESCRGH